VRAGLQMAVLRALLDGPFPCWVPNNSLLIAKVLGPDAPFGTRKRGLSAQWGGEYFTRPCKFPCKFP
jgi:hypothetical protein